MVVSANTVGVVSGSALDQVELQHLQIVDAIKGYKAKSVSYGPCRQGLSNLWSVGQNPPAKMFGPARLMNFEKKKFQKINKQKKHLLLPDYL